MEDGDRDVDRYRTVGELFAALAAPARSAIVHRLIESEASVGQLVAELGLSQPLVSQHLRVLRSARIVDSHRHGRTVVYAITDDHVAHIFLDAFHHCEENPT